MKRVLILTAGYGEGHNSAARGLAAALTEAGAEAEVRDIFREAYGRRQMVAERLYIECINRAAPLWAAAYQLMDHTPLLRWMMPAMGAVRRRLADVLAERQPCAVASVYPAYGWLLDRIFPKMKPPFASHTVVTDSITVNSVWWRFRSDSWIVPNEATADVLRNAVPAEQVHALGFPVQMKFADAKIVRQPPGDGEPLRIFYMVNHGHSVAARLVGRLLEIPGIALTVAYGKETAVGRAIAEAAQSAGRKIELHGWTPLVPELLMQNHLLIGKAGGAATQEAIAAKTPMLITKAVPGQEEGNARLIVENGCGAMCESDDAIVEAVALAAENHAALWHRWHAAITKLSKPDASREIARFILAGS
jgi:processive 1,2-diacylglycerol beta-glucosyltransferase